jgi:hypothetical protein
VRIRAAAAKIDFAFAIIVFSRFPPVLLNKVDLMVDLH